MEQKFGCQNCGDEFGSEEMLKRHNSWNCKDKRCKNCDTRFLRMRDLKHHQENNENLDCKHCLRKFCNEDHLQRHLRTISGDKKPDINLNQPIFQPSGYDEYPQYQRLMEEKDA